MIGSIVPQDYGVVLPTGRVVIKNLDQLGQEKRDDIAVGCRVREAVPDLSLRVKCGDHGYSRDDCVQSAVAIAALLCPHSSDEARLVEPRLINIYNTLALLQQG